VARAFVLSPVKSELRGGEADVPFWHAAGRDVPRSVRERALSDRSRV